MKPLDRRSLLKLSTQGVAAGAIAIAGVTTSRAARAAAPGALLSYPMRELISAKQLGVGKPWAFVYPDAASPCALLRLGRRVLGGVGPEGDIVAFSTLCAHRGCPVVFDPEAGTFKCPCHFSIFDPEKQGQLVCGQATRNLPTITLVYDAARDRLSAVGVQGLIHGRAANVLPEA